MKTNIKIRVTPEQSTKIQEICFENGIEWLNVGRRYIGNIIILYIGKDLIFSGVEFYEAFQEIDADLFIRTNGTCEEINFQKTQDAFNNLAIQVLEAKLKKKNEILKKARVKRKNQREELHKLNIKLQKCISLESHNIIIDSKNIIIKRLEDENYLNKSKLHLSSLNNIAQEKEIEKLKTVIEYLESKTK